MNLLQQLVSTQRGRRRPASYTIIIISIIIIKWTFTVYSMLSLRNLSCAPCAVSVRSKQKTFEITLKSPRVAFRLSEMQEDCSMQTDQHRKMSFCHQSSACSVVWRVVHGLAECKWWRPASNETAVAPLVHDIEDRGELLNTWCCWSG